MTDENSNILTPTFAHTGPQNKTKNKNNANTQWFPFFSWLSEDIWEVLTAWRQTRQRHVGDSCLLIVWQCDVRGLARQRSRRQTDWEPLFCSSCLDKQKNNNNKNQRSAIVKQELCKSLPQPRCPQGGGGWGMGVGGQCINWPLPTVRVAALLKDGLSVPLVSDSKLTSNETRVEACGITWRRSHPLFFASAWWNAAANVLRPRPLRSAWEKEKKSECAVSTRFFPLQQKTAEHFWLFSCGANERNEPLWFCSLYF